MKQEEIKQIHENIDMTIAQIAATLADDKSDKPISTERDAAIIMACCSIAKSELPKQDREGATWIENDLMRRWMDQIKERVESLQKGEWKTAATGIIQVLAEFSYEFDEELSKKFDELKENIETTVATGPEGEAVRAASPLSKVEDDERDPAPEGGLRGPISHVNTEGTEGYGVEGMSRSFRQAIKIDLGAPDGAVMPDIGNWFYTPGDILIYQPVGMEVKRVEVQRTIENKKHEDELTLCNEETPNGPCTKMKGHKDEHVHTNGDGES